MPLPESLTAVAIHNQYVDAEGNYETGNVTFETVWIDAPADDMTVVATTVIAETDAEGNITKTIPATNDPSVAPDPWYLKVTERMANRAERTYYIEVPQDTVGTLELASVTPVVPVDEMGQYVTQADLEAAVSEAITGDIEDIVTDQVTADINAQKGANNGIASLDSGGDVPLTQLGNAPVQSVAGKTGAVTLAGGDITSGTVAAARLPIGTANGVAGLDSGTKVPVAQIPDLPGTIITSGSVAAARIADLSATYINVSQKAAASGVASLDSGTKIPVAQVPNLPGSIITSGTVPAANIADLSATYIPTTQKAAASGVASLDASSLLVQNLSGAKITTGTVADARLSAGIQALLLHNYTCRVSRSTSLAHPDDTEIILNGLSEEKDNYNFFNSGTSSARMIIPSGAAGEYTATCWVTWGNDATGTREVTIYRIPTGGGTAVAVASMKTFDTKYEDKITCITPTVTMAVGDAFEARAWTWGGTAMTISKIVFSCSYQGPS